MGFECRFVGILLVDEELSRTLAMPVDDIHQATGFTARGDFQATKALYHFHIVHVIRRPSSRKHEHAVSLCSAHTIQCFCEHAGENGLLAIRASRNDANLAPVSLPMNAR